ncbi:MAG: autotransporter-associated beta strand repeat-containing protein, partial [Verrucomicrobia bacterium]|nr:autotransporter-associated beta strand repeat-containing protein [Verrucomicrobiota bacterium]
FTGSGSISGPTALLKQGSGALLIDNSGSNDFSGGVTIAAGTLQVGNNDTAGNLPAGAVTDNGALAFNRTDSVTVGNAVSGSGSLTQAGAAGTLLLNGANTFAGPVLVTNGSTLKLGGSSALGSGSASLTVANGSTLDANGYTASKTVILSGSGVGGNGAIVNSGGPIYDNPGPGLATNLILAGDATFSFPTRTDLGSASGGSVLTADGPHNLTLNGSGYFEWRNLSVLPPLAGITVGAGTLGVTGSTTFGDPNAALTLNGASGAALQLYGPGVFVNKQVDFQNGATIYNSSGANTMNGAMTLESGYCTFNVGNNTSLSLSNVLSGPGVFYLTGGTGTTVLWGNSPSFTGGVQLYNGQLVLNGLIGSGITSQPGTTVSGSGTANGLVDVSGELLPGGEGAAGTFTAGVGLTLESSATLTMDLSSTAGVGGGTNDLLAVTGDLTVNGNNIVINPIKGSLADGTYTLFTYTGNLNGAFGAAATAGPSRYTFTLDTGTPHQVNLVVAGQPDLLEWNNGANNGQWDVAGSLNWSNLTTHTQDQFLIPDTVLLDDSILTAANPTTSITIPAGQVVVPNVLTNDSTTNYTIGGAGKISGGASLVKLGSSTLTLSTTNDFTGNVTIGAGAVQINGVLKPTASPVGTTNGTLIVANGASLIVNLQGSYPA